VQYFSLKLTFCLSCHLYRTQALAIYTHVYMYFYKTVFYIPRNRFCNSYNAL